MGNSISRENAERARAAREDDRAGRLPAVEPRPRRFAELDFGVDVPDQELWLRIARLAASLRAHLVEAFRRRRCATCIGPLVEYEDRRGVFFCASCLSEADPPAPEGEFEVRTPKPELVAGLLSIHRELGLEADADDASKR